MCIQIPICKVNFLNNEHKKKGCVIIIYLKKGFISTKLKIWQVQKYVNPFN